MAVPTLDTDPFAPDFFEHPESYFAALRDAGPVVRLGRYDVHAVARYEQVRAVLTDWQTFSSASGVGLLDFRRETPWRLPSLVHEADPPMHTRPRRVLGRVLSANAIKDLRAGFEQAADALIDTLVARGSFDAVPDLAEAYPLQVFPDAVGIQPEGRSFLMPYGNMVFNAFGPRNHVFEQSTRDAAPVVAWVQAQSQREALAPDGLGARVHEAVRTGDLTEEEAPILVRSLLSAGVYTTASAIGAAVYCLARFPAELARLRADPELAKAAFEEAIRYETPVQSFFRTTTCAIDIEGVKIGEGEKVLMFLGAANRDPRHWERADDYDIGRATTGHLGFGLGIHQCVGMALARLEGECVLSALARKVASIEITGPVRRRYNNTIRGWSSLPVTVRPA